MHWLINHYESLLEGLSMDEGQNDIWLLGIINKEVGMSRSGVVDKPLACQPGVAGSIPGFSCLSDETLMTLAVGGTLNTNKQINKP